MLQRLNRRFYSNPLKRQSLPQLSIQSSVTDKKIQVVSLVDPSAGASATALVIPMGSRDEGEVSGGVAHYAKHALFLSNPQESHISMTRKAELRGSQFSVMLGRESITLIAEHPTVFQSEALETLAGMLTKRRVEGHEMAELSERVAWDRELALCDVEEVLSEAAHRVAFRRGLGNLLYASEVASESMQAATVSEFLNQAFGRINVALSINGEHGKLYGQAMTILDPLVTSGKSAASRIATTYHGGHVHIEAESSLNEALLAFKTAGMQNGKEWHLSLLLNALLAHPKPVAADDRILGQLAAKLRQSINSPLALRPFFTAHSDAGLLGIRVTSPQSTKLQPILQSCLESLRQLAAVPVEADRLEAARSTVLFERADRLSQRHSAAIELTQMLNATGKVEDLPSLQQSLAAIQPTDIQKVS